MFNESPTFCRPVRLLSMLIGMLGLCSTAALMAYQESDVERNWPDFRGPTGNGVSLSAQPPSEWSGTRNVAWKTAIPGKGSSSPIIWGDRIFLSTAQRNGPENVAPRPNRRELFRKFDADGDGRLDDQERKKATAEMRAQKQKSLSEHQFIVLCFDRATGKILWQDTATQRKPNDGHHQDHGYASSSPVTDGEHVYFSFGSHGVFCYDFQGNKVWERLDLGTMETRGGFGEGSSLSLHEDTLILPWDHEGPSRIETLDKKTGKTMWKQPRDEPSNWATPRVVAIGGKKQIIHAGENYTRGYDFSTGKEIWRSSGLSSRPVSSPVVFRNLGVFSSSRRGARLNAYYLDQDGDVSNNMAWSIDRQTPDCPSLLLSETRLFYVSGNRGILSCANVTDGSSHFSAKRLPGIDGIYSSPVAAGGKVYVTGRNGSTVVIEDGTSFKQLAKNDIGEPVDATLAPYGNQLFIRGSTHLFCIQDAEQNR